MCPERCRGQKLQEAAQDGEKRGHGGPGEDGHLMSNWPGGITDYYITRSHTEDGARGDTGTTQHGLTCPNSGSTSSWQHRGSPTQQWLHEAHKHPKTRLDTQCWCMLLETLWDCREGADWPAQNSISPLGRRLAWATKLSGSESRAWSETQPTVLSVYNSKLLLPL